MRIHKNKFNIYEYKFNEKRNPITPCPAGNKYLYSFEKPDPGLGNINLYRGSGGWRLDTSESMRIKMPVDELLELYDVNKVYELNEQIQT